MPFNPMVLPYAYNQWFNSGSDEASQRVYVQNELYKISISLTSINNALKEIQEYLKTLP